MHLLTAPPPPALRPYVRRFALVRFAAAHADAHLPGTGLVAAFRVRGECRLEGIGAAPAAAVTGLHDRLRRHAHGAGNAMALASFTPLGAAALLGGPLHEIANTSVAMEDLLGGLPALRALQDRLVHARDAAQTFEALQDFFLRRLDPAREADPLVAAAVDWIERAPPGARVTALVRHIGLSQSALERRFRHAVGASPKRYAALVRLERVLALGRARQPLAAVAQAAGYFDQSHFIRDFKRLTGRTPQAYFAGTR